MNIIIINSIIIETNSIILIIDPKLLLLYKITIRENGKSSLIYIQFSITPCIN